MMGSGLHCIFNYLRPLLRLWIWAQRRTFCGQNWLFIFWLEEVSAFLKNTYCSGCGYGTFVQALFNDLFKGTVFSLIWHIMYQLSRWRSDMWISGQAQRKLW